GIQASGISAVGYAISTPSAPSVVVGSSGSCVSSCVASGTWFYGISAVDIANRVSVVSSPTSVTVDGTQTVTVSWTPVNGQVKTNPFRGPSANNLTGSFVIGSGCAGNSYTDTTNFPGAPCNGPFYTASVPGGATGNAESLSSAGVSGH